MSVNLHALIEDAESGIKYGMMLTRVSRGITSTATLAVGERINFSGVLCDITEIIHEHAAPISPHAPNSHVFVKFEPLTEEQQTILHRHGFDRV